MNVRAKMRVTSVAKTGDNKKPSVSVQLGCVYSQDPESENRSFANATPTGSVSLHIDAGRPAANAFELGAEFFVDFTPLGVPSRFYVRDIVPVESGEYMLESRDGEKTQRVFYDQPKQAWRLMPTSMCINYQAWHESLVESGWTHWRYLKDGE